jgi:hypothetical protein
MHAIHKTFFNCFETWEVLRENMPTVSWWKTVWFSKAIPRHSFILWLAFQDALPTKARMSTWGYGGNVLCPFCYGCIESRDHLFFSCSFSRRIWKILLSACLVSDPRQEWDDVVEWSSAALKGKSLWTTLCRLCFAAAVYHIWRQRNDLLHGNVPRTEEQFYFIFFDKRTEEQIVAHIRWEVKTKIMASCRILDMASNQRLIQEWTF